MAVLLSRGGLPSVIGPSRPRLYSASPLRAGSGRSWRGSRRTADGQGRHWLEDVARLRRAPDRGELVLHCRPEPALCTGVIDGVEAFVRWQHPTRELLCRDALIDLAESAGLMSRLTSQVIDMALAQSRAWADDGRELTMAVGVSPSNLVGEQFPDDVATPLGSHGRPASTRVLEVTAPSRS